MSSLVIRLSKIRENLQKLQEVDPAGAILFGASNHGYIVNPPATLAMVLAFETKFEIEFPEEYREFLLQVGNGGAGPYYGLYVLQLSEGKKKRDVRSSFFYSMPELMTRNWTREWGNIWHQRLENPSSKKMRLVTAWDVPMPPHC